MKKVLAISALWFLALSTTGAEAIVTASDVLARIDKEGAPAVLKQLTSEYGWSEFKDVLAHVSTGDPGWLKVAAKLADATEEVDEESGGEAGLVIWAAVSKAVPRKPAAVLALIPDGFTAQQACSPFLHDATKAEYLDLLKSSITALGKMPPDASLDAARQDCLKFLGEKLKEVKKMPADPPQEILQPVLQLVDLLSDGSAEFYPQGLRYFPYTEGGDPYTVKNHREAGSGFVADFVIEGWGGGNSDEEFLAYFAPAYTGGRWVNKKYMLQNYLVVGARGWRYIKDVKLIKDTVILKGDEYGPNDGMCCPSVPVEIHVKIGEAGLEFVDGKAAPLPGSELH